MLLTRRIQLAFRGRRYKKRDAADLPAQALARLDILYAAASTLGFIDHLRGAALQTHHLAQALELGEERRICRAFAIEVAYLATQPGGRKASRALGLETLKMARKLDDSYLIGIVQMLRGGVQFFSGEAAEAIDTLRESDEALGHAREVVEWERVTGRYMISLSQIAIGDFAGAARTANRYTAEAERRNDVYARSLFMAIPTTWWLLCQDRSDAAERNLSTVLHGWPEDTYYVSNYIDEFSRILIHLYRGDGRPAMDQVDATLPGLSRIMLDRVAWIHSEIYTLKARGALMAGQPRIARQCLRYIRSAKLAYADAAVSLISAALHHAKGDIEKTHTQLQTASQIFSERSAHHLSAACDVRLGRLSDSVEGRELVARGMRALDERGVKAPERMIDFLAPGFETQEEP